MDQSTSMDHNYGVPFIPGHSYQKSNGKVVHHIPLGYVYALRLLLLCTEWRLFINWCIFFVYRCLHSLIQLRPQRLVEGRELTRRLWKCQTRCQFWVYLRQEKQGSANILPYPLEQPQAVKTFIVHGRRMIGSFLRTIIARSFKKPQEELGFLEKG